MSFAAWDGVGMPPKSRLTLASSFLRQAGPIASLSSHQRGLCRQVLNHQENPPPGKDFTPTVKSIPLWPIPSNTNVFGTFDSPATGQTLEFKTVRTDHTSVPPSQRRTAIKSRHVASSARKRAIATLREIQQSATRMPSMEEFLAHLAASSTPISAHTVTPDEKEYSAISVYSRNADLHPSSGLMEETTLAVHERRVVVWREQLRAFKVLRLIPNLECMKILLKSFEPSPFDVLCDMFVNLTSISNAGASFQRKIQAMGARQVDTFRSSRSAVVAIQSTTMVKHDLEKNNTFRFTWKQRHALFPNPITLSQIGNGVELLAKKKILKSFHLSQIGVRAEQMAKKKMFKSFHLSKIQQSAELMMEKKLSKSLHLSLIRDVAEELMKTKAEIRDGVQMKKTMSMALDLSQIRQSAKQMMEKEASMQKKMLIKSFAVSPVDIIGAFAFGEAVMSRVVDEVQPKCATTTKTSKYSFNFDDDDDDDDEDDEEDTPVVVVADTANVPIAVDFPPADVPVMVAPPIAADALVTDGDIEEDASMAVGVDAANVDVPHVDVPVTVAPPMAFADAPVTDGDIEEDASMTVGVDAVNAPITVDVPPVDVPVTVASPMAFADVGFTAYAPSDLDTPIEVDVPADVPSAGGFDVPSGADPLIAVDAPATADPPIVVNPPTDKDPSPNKVTVSLIPMFLFGGLLLAAAALFKMMKMVPTLPVKMMSGLLHKPRQYFMSAKANIFPTPINNSMIGTVETVGVEDEEEEYLMAFPARPGCKLWPDVRRGESPIEPVMEVR